MSVGLVLESGGNKGIYIAGVLDVLIENNIFFPVTYAISTGAYHSLSYISKQHKRNYEIMTRYTSDKRYLSFNILRKTGSLYGFDFIFGELSTELIPFDYNEFFKSSMQLRVGATDCETGKYVFYDKTEMKRDFTSVVASTIMPVFSNIIDYKGKKLLSGDITAPIPLDVAIADGIKNNVVILTSSKDDMQKSKVELPLHIIKKKYINYPNLINAVNEAYKIYNNEKKLCYQMQNTGNALVIQPSKPITIPKYNKNIYKLKEIYDMGVNDAKENLVNIRRFIALNS